MIEYIIPHNPDDRVLKNASQLLQEGKLICFPADTSWTLAACCTNKDAIDKLYKIKKEDNQKHFSLLCDSISKASELAHIDNQAFKLLKKTIPGHYTFIFEATKKMAKYIQASKTDKEVGIRFIPIDYVQKIIEVHGKPLVCTNITNSILGISEDDLTPIYSYQLEESISHLASMIIDPGEFEFVEPSTIIDFVNDQVPAIIREGSGDISPFI